MASMESSGTDEIDADLAANAIECENDETEMEHILNDIGGTFGRFQLYNYILLSALTFSIGIMSMSFVFTTLNLEHRCYIPECDNTEHAKYDADWVPNIIPTTNVKLAKCHRYKSSEHNISHSSATFNVSDGENQYCYTPAPNKSVIVKCDQDGVVYKTNEVSIAREFNLTCEENEWKLAVVGAVSSSAYLISMSISGLISDRFGRKTLVIYGLGLSAISGLIQSFSINYGMFLIMEFTTSIIMSGVYAAGFILSIEWPNVTHRVIISTIVTAMYPIGVAVSSVMALYTAHFRVYMRWVFGFQLIVSAFMFLVPESLRWLLVKGKQNQIERILKTAARINHRQLSPSTLELINRKCNKSIELSKLIVNDPAAKNKQTLKALLSSSTMIFRFFISCLCWITGTYVTVGVNVISVSLSGDKYVSFAVTALGGLPSILFLIYFLKHFGRPKCISISLLITSFAIIVAKYLPEEYVITELILFFVAECFSSTAFSAVYLHTSELYPTPLRHSMMGICSTVGRLGSISAPLAPLLASIYEPLPFLSFGIICLITGTLVLFLPETLNREIPDTIEEALNLGKTKKNDPSRM